MALSFLPEKSAGRAAFNSEVCKDMAGDTVGARGAGPTEGAGVTVSTGRKEASGAGDKVCASWEFLPVDRQG